MTRDLPYVSVIVPVRDDPRLARCLAALERQDFPPDRYEVIVVDNGSRVRPLGVVADCPHARLVVEHRPGAYAARNRGLAVARGVVLAFTDADCLPEPDWLARGVSALQGDDGLGIVAGEVVVFPVDPAHPTSLELHEMVHAFPQRRYVTEGRFGVTANLFTRRSVIDAVGSFRSDVRAGGDKEWCRRAHTAGCAITFDATVRVRHPARRTWAEVHRKLLRVHMGAIEREGPARELPPYWRHLVPPLGSAWRGSRSPALNGPRQRLRYALAVVVVRYVGLLARVQAARVARRMPSGPPTTAGEPGSSEVPGRAPVRRGTMRALAREDRG